jgi:chaperonin GroES
MATTDQLLQFFRETGGKATFERICDQFFHFNSEAEVERLLKELEAAGEIVFNRVNSFYSLVDRAPTRLSDVNLEPMPGKVIIRLDTSDKQVGGLWLMRSARQSIGQIVAIYNDFDDPDTDAHIAPFLHLRDWVIFGQHSGVEVDFNREKYIILRESEILCRVIDPDAVPDRKGVQAT